MVRLSELSRREEEEGGKELLQEGHCKENEE